MHVACGADNSRYHQLKVDLSNDMTKGTNNFPKTMVETMRILIDYIPHQGCSAHVTQMARDWPSYKVRAEHRVVQRRTASTRKWSAGTAAGRTTITSAPSSSCSTWASRTSTLIRAMESTPYSPQTTDAALSRSKQKGCGASCLLTTCTSTRAQATPALPTLISSQT